MQQGNEENVIIRTNVIKRNGQEVTFDITKIINAIGKANHEVAGIHQMNDFQIRAIADNIAKKISNYPHAANVEDIQDMVETGIMEMRGYEVAQKYVRYRYKREISRKSNTTDDGILSLIELNNEEVKQENSNKNPVINSTQRDYMAGETSRAAFFFLKKSSRPTMKATFTSMMPTISRRKNITAISLTWKTCSRTVLSSARR